jgi:hypothetical protein
MSTPARRLREVAAVPATPGGTSELGALEAISAAVESGSGLPDVVRAAAKALDCSVVLLDQSGAVLVSAAKSPADERTLLTGGPQVTVEDLRVADQLVGRLHLRARSKPPSPVLLGVVKTLVAGEVERVRAPERASVEAAAEVVALLLRRGGDRDDLLARTGDLGVNLADGGCVVVARAHPRVPTDDDWRARVLAVAERGARAVVPTALAAASRRPDARAGEVVIVVPGSDEGLAERTAAGVARELEAGLAGFAFALGRSRVATDVVDLHRAGDEALLAANVAEADDDVAVLAFDATGAYRLLLPAMSEHPDELRRFFADTLEPVCSYDEQYETELVRTIEAFLDCDGNVAQTAQRLFAHRHTIRYRLERVHELCGLDVGSSDGREKLSLGLKAMRVLGIPAPRGPANEPGASGGRVPNAPA